MVISNTQVKHLPSTASMVSLPGNQSELLHQKKETIVQQPVNVTWRLLRGSLAGTVAKTVVYPLDRLKMIYQVQSSVVGRFYLRSFYKEFRRLQATEGWLSLWKGNFAAVCRTFPHSGIVFFCFDTYEPMLTSVLPGCPYLCRLLAGGFSGMTSTVITYPLDVWNTRMAISRGHFKYRQVALLSIEGLRSLTRGLCPTLIGIIPYAGISFLTYETLKSYRLEMYKKQTQQNQFILNPIESIVCGGIAGVVSQSATYPLDTIRKMMQANTFLFHFNQPGHWGQKHHPKIIDVIQFINKTVGWKGFYNGLSLNWFKGFIATGIAFCINEQFKRIHF